MAEWVIRPLSRDDDRSAFSCGEPALDRFFQHYAGQNQFKLHLAVTYVLEEQGQILGFATLASGSIEREGLPDPSQRHKMPSYPLPVLRLARLGVDQRAQGRGVGLSLLRFALRLALAQRDSVGCVGVVVDAKPGALDFYQRLGFVALQGVREGLLHGEPTPMFLGVGVIGAAVREG